MFRIIPEGTLYQEHVLLKNGQGLLFKPAKPNDSSKVTEFMSRLSQETLRMRFMASVSVVSEKVINELCNGDFKDNGCLLAIVGEGEDTKIVGLANYLSIGNTRTAEVAFLVEDSYQGLGISTLLLERLSGIAAANGIIEFEAEVLPENQQMLSVFKSSGFEIHKVWDSDTVHIEFPVDGASSLWKRTALRERIAVANSLIPLLRPNNIAVTIVDNNPTSIGNMIFKNIISGDYSGTVYPINHEAVSVRGVKAYSSLKKLPDKIDLSIISIKAEEVLEAAKESIEAGAKAIVVVSTGFAESGLEGKERQKKLVELVRANGVRLLGPSCLGVINTDPAISLNASLLPNISRHGKIGMFAHSAALGLVILNYAQSLGLSFTTFVSAGNRADVSGNDFLQYWEEDHKTAIVILYLETFGNPRRFVRIARSMSYKKPILCVKGASSIAGRKTVEEKIGSITAGSLEVEALFHQTGIIMAPTLEELFDTAIILENQPLPEGNKVGIIANSAGMATIFADACEMNNLELSGNCLMNLGAFTSPEKYEEAVFSLLSNDNVDSIFVGFASVGKDMSNEIALSIKKAVKDFEIKFDKSKPVLLCLMGTTGTVNTSDKITQNENDKTFPAFRFPESAVRALSRIVNYSEFKKNPPGKIVWYSDIKADETRELVQKLIAENRSEKKLLEVDQADAQKIMNSFGIETVNENVEGDKLINLEIRTDVLFGPVMELGIAGEKKLLRITPLTERDLEEIFESLPIENTEGLKEVMGRLSQMIEELPWLYSLSISAVKDENPKVMSKAIMKLGIHDIKRPTY